MLSCKNYIKYFEHLLIGYKNIAIFMSKKWKIKGKRKRTLRKAGLYGNYVMDIAKVFISVLI